MVFKFELFDVTVSYEKNYNFLVLGREKRYMM